MPSIYDRIINNPLSQASKSLVNFLLPSTVRAGQKSFEDVGAGKSGRLTKQEAKAMALGPLGAYLFGSDRQKAGSKAGAELASYLIPFGKGANIASKFLLPGAVSGGLRSASEENVTPQSLAGGATGGAIGAGITGGALSFLGKAGQKLTKNFPEGIMNRIFKEPVKATKAAIKGGQTLGEMALQKGVKGNEQTILQTAVSKMDDLENLVANSLKNSAETVDINDILKTVQPLIDKYKKAGNEAAAKALENRVMNIWQANGEKIPVAAANEIKRTLYKEVGNAYGQLGSEGVEGIKSVARGIKETIVNKVPSISKLNEELGFWGRSRDAMIDRLARYGRNNAIGLTDAILAAGGGAAAGPAGLLTPILTKTAGSTAVKTNLANMLNKVGSSVTESGIPSTLNQILGVGAAQAGSRLVPEITGQRQENQNYSPYDNSANTPHAQSITPPVNTAAQGAQGQPKDVLSEDGQWKWDFQANDWVPNPGGQATAEGAQPGGGFTREQIGQAMLLDLAQTGGKNLAELKTLSEFLIPEESKKKPLTAVQQQLATNVESANRSIDKVENILKTDPNIIFKAAIPGVGGRLAGASTYTTAAKEIADVIARMRTGAVINDEEMKNYLSKLPQIGDSPEDITYKIGELRFIFQSLKERLENQSGPDIQINAGE